MIKRHLSAIAAAMIASTMGVIAAPIELADFVKLPRPVPTEILSYGDADVQAVDLFMPESPGPHPVAILIHGGCWKDIPGAGREQLRAMGEVLAQRGIAAWSIGYRRADEAGGGYPGTFEDVADAIDLLRREAGQHDLDLSRTVVVGHSAGGHLALWAAVRDRLPQESMLKSSQPFMPGAVISLAGVGDLRAFSPLVPVICGPGVLEKLLPRRAPGEAFAEISPAELPAPEIEVAMVSGVLDRLVPPYVAHDFARAMQDRHGRTVARIDIAEAGHFDLVTPGTQAWDLVLERIEAALGLD
jgi:acetyl esterase/lipase